MSEHNYYLIESMVQAKFIIIFMGPDIKDKDWSYVKCQPMIIFRHCDYDHRCDRANHNKCWFIVTVIKDLFKIKEITLFFKPSILFKSLRLSPGSQFWSN